MMEFARTEANRMTRPRDCHPCFRLSARRSNLFRHHVSVRAVPGERVLPALGRLGTRVVVAFVLPDRPGDASEFVGEGHGGLVAAATRL